MALSHWQIPFTPLAAPEAVVLAGNARFTVLTSRLLRLEYSPTGIFEDRPSQVFWFREQPVPAFTVRRDGLNLEIHTEELLLRYSESPDGFAPRTLQVTVYATGQTWHYGQSNWQGNNLRGTARTLDNAGGQVELGWGVIARSGWALVDDSTGLVFDQTGWPVPRNAPPDSVDLYFFGYGHAYRDAVRDLTQISGPVPMIPRWALGNWWSRFWPYAADELLGLMRDFRSHQVPLSVCIVDMDWHITNTGNASSGWTGYTWNKALFPDPPAFLAALHNLGLKTALNLHPADGIFPHETQYAAVAQSMGVDPASEKPIPFNIADPHFTQVYFEELHHPHEAAGVDFWWMDWQQGTQSKVAGLDPLWWLNHLHFYDLARNGDRRAFVFSRWGGLGNHRYPIGFSGDTIIGWEALAYQPHFTATAANVAYGWWSHDIGGHMGGVEDDELYARWVQYGVFSPIFRLHSTRNDFIERRPWARGLEADKVASDAMRLRHRLIPYIYSAAWHAHQTGEALITPMYYSNPEDDDAYQCPDQYWFGRELIAAPFIRPAHAETGMASQQLWLPSGEWFNFFSGERLLGNGWRTVYGTLSAIPLFARAGAIVPMEGDSALDVFIFPGADNTVTLYDDDGESDHYKQGAFALTQLSQTWDESLLRFEIAPVQGQKALIPAGRAYRLCVRGIPKPADVKLWLNDLPVALTWDYDHQTETLTTLPLTLAPESGLRLEVSAPNLSLVRSRASENAMAFLRAFKLDTWAKHHIQNDLPRLINGELDLRRYHALTAEQISALKSVLRSV